MIQDRALIKGIEDYVFKNESKYSDFIYKNRSKIPDQFKTSSSTLYRGMILPVEMVDSTNFSLKLESPSSWSHSKKQAERFVSDKSKIVGGKKSGTVGVIFKITATKSNCILDIHKFCQLLELIGPGLVNFDDSTLEMGLEEQEVLLVPNITLKKSNIVKIVK